MNIANRGLFVAQRQLDVTGHNIANENVDGYSRQRYVTSAVDPRGYHLQFAPTERGKVGGGVETLSLDQIRDLFLDRQFRNEQTKTTYWNTRSNAMYYVEDVFNSIDSNSLDGVMSSFFAGLQELSVNPTDEAIRTNVSAQAKKMVDVFHMYHTQMTDLMTQQDFNLVEQTKHSNELLDRLASLNDNIFKFELGGSVANDLRDERALILDELSGMMDISYTEVSFEPPMYSMYGRELTQLKVYAGPNAAEDYDDLLLVSHKESFHLETREESGFNEIADNEEPPVALHNIYLASGVKLSPDEIDGYSGGQLQSYIDIRDGSTFDKTGIPYFLEQINTLVRTFVTEFNTIHNQGFTMPFSNTKGSSDSSTGVDFFDPDGLTARTVALSEDILTSSFNIAASTEFVTVDAEGHLQTGNNLNVLALIKGIKERNDLPDIGSIEGFYKNFLGELASEAASANNMDSSQNVLLESIHSQRVSVSGVDEDEEMTNLIKFQHAYNASARTITTMDEMLDKLINGTGRVGL